MGVAQICTAALLSAEARRFPSGDHATAYTMSSCGKVWKRVPLAVFDASVTPVRPPPTATRLARPTRILRRERRSVNKVHTFDRPLGSGRGGGGTTRTVWPFDRQASSRA